MLATPGAAFDVATMPYTSVDAVLTGVAGGELVLTDTGIDFVGPAYYDVLDGGIAWMIVLCGGYQPMIPIPTAQGRPESTARHMIV